MENEPVEEDMSPVELQRRLELKEFYLEKGNDLAARLVDQMFRLGSFKEIKQQVIDRYGDLPTNWKDNDRYYKYQQMLKLGVKGSRVREQMVEDGIDPDEFEVAKVKLGSVIMSRTSNILRSKSYQQKSPMLSRLRSKKVNKSGEKETRREKFMKKKQRRKLESLSLSESESSLSGEEGEREDFFFSKETVEEDGEVSMRRKKKGVFGDLTKKNKVGQLHDFKPFFPDKPQHLLRKTSVSNIKRRRANTSLFKDEDFKITFPPGEETLQRIPKGPPPRPPRKKPSNSPVSMNPIDLPPPPPLDPSYLSTETVEIPPPPPQQLNTQSHVYSEMQEAMFSMEGLMTPEPTQQTNFIDIRHSEKIKAKSSGRQTTDKDSL